MPLVCLVACTQNKSDFRGFSTPDGLKNAIIVPTDSINTTIIKADEPLSSINASDIIEEVRFIPLETNKEALIAYYNNIMIYDDKIYIIDNLQGSGSGLFIFDMNGKFLNKIGQKGGGPQDFGLPSGFDIARNGNYFMVYDNWKRRNMYYDMDGNFLKKSNVSFRQFFTFGILPSNTVVSVTGKSDHNHHLGDYDKYRLVFSDTLGNINKFGFEFDDNMNLPVGWSSIYRYNNELLYYQQYANSIYSVTDTLIREKYRIDCSNFSAFDIKKINQYDKMEDFDEYWYRTANLYPSISENNNHLFFTINNMKEYHRYFYDKRSGKHIGFKKMNFDNDFCVQFSNNFYSYGDYFIRIVSPVELAELKKNRDKEGKPLSEKFSKMIDGLDEEDNDVLVLFKIKEL